MKVRFWGVRGSIAVSDPRFARTGGNTTCVELSCQGERLILDGGTGLRALGEARRGPMSAMVLFSHVHWDHIQGVPFFGPAFHPASRLILAGATTAAGTLEDALRAQMQPPQFPVTLEALQARVVFREVEPGIPFRHGPFRVLPERGHHPDGVLSYRVEAGGRSVVFATDVEHAGRLDETLVTLAAGADLLIHDAQYTPEEYAGQVGPSRAGWGHSTWIEAVAVARDCGARRLALFHHDPGRDDDALAVVEHRVRREFPEAFAAREGAVVGL